MDTDEYTTNYVKSRAHNYDVRIRHEWLEDPKLQFDLDGEENRAFMNLLRWTETKLSDGWFDRKHTAMVIHMTPERLDRMVEVGVVEDHGDTVRIADPYRSWQSSFADKKSHAAKQAETNKRVQEWRRNQAVNTAPATTAEAPAPEVEDTSAAKLVAGVRVSEEVKRKLAAEVSKLSAQGFSPDEVSAALRQWARMPDKGPGYLPYLIKPDAVIDEQQPDVLSAIKEARHSTGADVDVSGLVDFGYRWTPPDEAPPRIGAKAVRQLRNAQKLKWLDEIEAKIRAETVS